MKRLWWFTVLVVGAVFVHFTPAAYAGCEGGATAAGHNAIQFCCGGEKGRGDGGNSGHAHDARVLGGHISK